MVSFSHTKFRTYCYLPCRADKFDTGYTRLEQQQKSNVEYTFASLYRFAVERKVENNGRCKPFCVTRNLENTRTASIHVDVFYFLNSKSKNSSVKTLLTTHSMDYSNQIIPKIILLYLKYRTLDKIFRFHLGQSERNYLFYSCLKMAFFDPEKKPQNRSNRCFFYFESILML